MSINTSQSVERGLFTDLIFEAEFMRSNLTVARFKQKLAAIFDVEPDSIDTATVTSAWGNESTSVVTFSRSGTEYLVMAAFAGVNGTRQQSGDAARGYLAVNAEDWEMVDQE